MFESISGKKYGRYLQSWRTSRYESNEIIRFDEPIFHMMSSDFVCLLRDAVHLRVFSIVHVTVQWKSHFCSIPSWTHARSCTWVYERVVHIPWDRCCTFLRVDTDILEFHERRGEHRRSDHKFRFPSRRETIRFHLAIYIRAKVMYVRQIEPENRAHVSWRSREAPVASRGCLKPSIEFLDQRVVASIVYA